MTVRLFMKLERILFAMATHFLNFIIGNVCYCLSSRFLPIKKALPNHSFDFRESEVRRNGILILDLI